MHAATIGSTVVIGALALSTGPDAVQVAALAPATTIQLVLPIDVVELVKAVFTGIAAIGSIIAAIYAAKAKIQAANAYQAAGRAETVSMAADTKIETVSKQIDGLLTDRDAAKVKEGEATATVAAGVTAEATRLGVEQGIAQERASVAAANPAAPAPATGAIVPGEAPVPVEDDRAAKIGERGVAAAEALADATKDIAATAKKP